MPESNRLILVTGVSGFVGSAVARALDGRGYSLRGLVRSGSSPVNLLDFPGDLVEGDLRDPSAMAGAMRGVDTLFHVAADYRLWARDPEDIVRNNLSGTQCVMEAALKAGVGRIVYTSSVATLKPSDAGAVDERASAAPSEAIGAYKRSKVVAERLVERLVAQQGLPAVIVQPSTPIGPRDVKPTPTGRIIVEAARGRMPAFIDSGLNLAHVDDVAHGHVLAMEKGTVGERYILGGQDVMLGEMLGAIATHVGRKPPRVRLPRRPLMPLAWMNEGLARLSGGGDPFLTLDSLRMARHRMFFSSAKAERELGYAARPWQAAIGDAVDWFRQMGTIQ
ncbi:hopanoid-associated sugar epimerase [Novosphingobium sp. BL-8H]|uniref:hopanoid-associated sugar epimerase n=1 Tax=Novosphingobium sp. BL-8H TaxID=3127640 RepID=UPI003756BA58